MRDAASQGAAGLGRAIVSGTLWTLAIVAIGWFALLVVNIWQNGSAPLLSYLGSTLVVFGITLVCAFVVWFFGVLICAALCCMFFSNETRARRGFWPLVGGICVPLAVLLFALADVPLGALPFSHFFGLLPEGPALAGPMNSVLGLTVVVLPVYVCIGWRAGVRLRGPERAPPCQGGVGPQGLRFST